MWHVQELNGRPQRPELGEIQRTKHQKCTNTARLVRNLSKSVEGVASDTTILK
ncbi:unnamed protein product [Ixodes persulcatus]